MTTGSGSVSTQLGRPHAAASGRLDRGRLEQRLLPAVDERPDLAQLGVPADGLLLRSVAPRVRPPGRRTAAGDLRVREVGVGRRQRTSQFTVCADRVQRLVH